MEGHERRMGVVEVVVLEFVVDDLGRDLDLPGHLQSLNVKSPGVVVSQTHCCSKHDPYKQRMLCSFPNLPLNLRTQVTSF